MKKKRQYKGFILDSYQGCPDCKEPTWEHHPQERYLFCPNCGLMVDYMIEDWYMQTMIDRHNKTSAYCTTHVYK